MVIECCLDKLYSFTVENIGLFAWQHLAIKTECLPLFLHIIHGVLIGKLLGSLITDLVKLILVVSHLEAFQVSDAHILQLLVMVLVDLHLHENHLDVSILQTLVTETSNDRNVLFKVHQISVHSVGDSLWFGHWWVSLLVKNVGKLHSLGSHFTMLSFDFLWIKALKTA